jgi:membrane fusion protein (multidrug efflux system)
MRAEKTPCPGPTARAGRAHPRARAASCLAGWCLAVAACGGAADTPVARGAPERAARDRAVPVTVAPAELGAAARSVTATGTVEPIRTVGVNSRLAGALQSVRVEEGDTVRQGAVLARMETRELEAQLASAEAALEVTRRAAERAEELRKLQIVTAAEYERDRAADAAARATRDQLRTRIGYATIRAPITGIITEKHVEAGDVVAVQARLFAVADRSTLVVRVPVSELDVPGLAAGQDVRVAIDALGGSPVGGRIRRIFPGADTALRMVPVEVALTGPDVHRVLPGYLARVTFETGPSRAALWVPIGAVVGASGSQSVFVIEAGRAARRPVRVGAVREGAVEVVEGLREGDSVVVAGQTELRDGVAVRVVPAPGSAPAEPQPAAPSEVGGSSGAQAPAATQAARRTP